MPNNSESTTIVLLEEPVASGSSAPSGRKRSLARCASLISPRLTFSSDPPSVAVYIKGTHTNVLYVDPLPPTAHSLRCVAFLDKHRYLNFLPLYFTWQKLKEAMVVADTDGVEVLSSMIESRLARSWF